MLDLRTQDFDYDLPPELIAQRPADRREHSRLMVVNRQAGTLLDDRFDRLGSHLRPGDLLVANRSKVIPARLQARRSTGGQVEILLIRPLEQDRWRALARPSRRLRPGQQLKVGEEGLCATVEACDGDGEWTVRFNGVEDVPGALRRAGTLPLPPYIRGGAAPAGRYQTIYADREGSIAAPTAGLHFSRELLAHLESAGIETAFVTLHVGLGTFKPVMVDRISDHQMHAEWGEVTGDLAARINRVREQGGRVVAVGTTTTRILETAAGPGGVRPFAGETSAFITPGYQFQAIDALITNFHLPRSTLLMLVSAFAGMELTRRAYQRAVAERYRFFSFGDAMLLL